MPSQVRLHPEDWEYVASLHIQRKAAGADKNMSDTMAHLIGMAKHGPELMTWASEILSLGASPKFLSQPLVDELRAM